jgi:hypothetical protein
MSWSSRLLCCVALKLYSSVSEEHATSMFLKMQETCPSERWYTTTKQHGTRTQKTKTSNLHEMKWPKNRQITFLLQAPCIVGIFFNLG